MNRAIKYSFGAVVFFVLGAVASYHVTKNYIEKSIYNDFTNLEASYAIAFMQALHKIREGNSEMATNMLEHHMTDNLIVIANPNRDAGELNESEIKASKMAVEYWEKFPDAKGQEFVRTRIENIANGK
jgi:hypothetical protein